MSGRYSAAASNDFSCIRFPSSFTFNPWPADGLPPVVRTVPRAGRELGDLDDPTLQILTNRDLLAIDQDPLGIQCRRHKTTIKVDTLVKPLSGGDVAVCFFNKFGEAEEEAVSIRELLETEYCGLPEAEAYEVTELWSGEQYDTPDEISAMIPPHGVKVYRIKAKEIAE